ncbi:unnamed protein product, partial [Prorocentrum cordatum]
MKDMMNEVRGMNNNIAKLGQSMQQYMISFRNALIVQDQNVQIMNERLIAVEESSQDKITAAVALAVQEKMESVQENVSLTLLAEVGVVDLVVRPLLKKAREKHYNETVLPRYGHLLQGVATFFHGAFSGIYEPVLAELRKSPKWGPTCRLGVNGFKGVLLVRDEDGVWEIVAAKDQSKADAELIPIHEELAEWGISAEKASAIIEQSHKPFGSFCASAAAGGLRFFVSRRPLAKFTSVQLEPLCAGRIASLLLQGSSIAGCRITGQSRRGSVGLGTVVKYTAIAQVPFFVLGNSGLSRASGREKIGRREFFAQPVACGLVLQRAQGMATVCRLALVSAAAPRQLRAPPCAGLERTAVEDQAQEAAVSPSPCPEARRGLVITARCLPLLLNNGVAVIVVAVTMIVLLRGSLGELMRRFLRSTAVCPPRKEYWAPMCAAESPPPDEELLGGQAGDKYMFESEAFLEFATLFRARVQVPGPGAHGSGDGDAEEGSGVDKPAPVDAELDDMFADRDAVDSFWANHKCDNRAILEASLMHDLFIFFVDWDSAFQRRGFSGICYAARAMATRKNGGHTGEGPEERKANIGKDKENIDMGEEDDLNDDDGAEGSKAMVGMLKKMMAMVKSMREDMQQVKTDMGEAANTANQAKVAADLAMEAAGIIKQGKKGKDKTDGEEDKWFRAVSFGRFPEDSKAQAIAKFMEGALAEAREVKSLLQQQPSTR